MLFNIGSVANQLQEAEVVTHLKQIIRASTAAVEMLYNTLTLIKVLSSIGQVFVYMYKPFTISWWPC